MKRVKKEGSLKRERERERERAKEEEEKKEKQRRKSSKKSANFNDKRVLIFERETFFR